MENGWEWGDETEDRSIDYTPEDEEGFKKEVISISDIYDLKERFDTGEELTTEELELLMEFFL